MGMKPRSLGFFEALPGRNIHASPKDIECACDTLKCDGAARLPNPGAKWRGAPGCTHAAYPMPIAALRAFAPSTQYLCGTDFPIEPMESTVTQIPGLKLPADIQHALDRGNAERLWPKFK